jgi:hydroxyacylglutathione hydrolase
MLEVKPIPIYQDNYVWMITKSNESSAYVVDPGDAVAVKAALDRRGLGLAGILITHCHWDHVTGIPLLVREFGCPVYGPAKSTLAQITHRLSEGDALSLWQIHPLEVWETPGHTTDHVSYIIPPSPEQPHCLLFCGDTLFSGGCGRLFNGTIEQLETSLNRIAQLPTNTEVYCTHEYTQSNLAFAAKVEQGNSVLADYIQQISLKRQNSIPSLPTTISQELAINPFLRCDELEVQESIQRHFGVYNAGRSALFKLLRQWKNKA